MADRYFIGAIDDLWSKTGNWSTTSGGAGGASVPTLADDVFLDANSPSCSTAGSNRPCKSLTCTGFTNTFTIATSAAVNVYGDITLVPAMTLVATAGVVVFDSGTITSAGKAFGNFSYSRSAPVTVTLADPLSCASFNISNAPNNNQHHILNGHSLTVTGNVNLSAILAGSLTGTTEFIFGGVGHTFNCTGLTGRIGISITLNNSGTVNITGNALRFGRNISDPVGGTGTLKRITGSFNTASVGIDFVDDAIIDLAPTTIAFPISFRGGDFIFDSALTTSSTIELITSYSIGDTVTLNGGSIVLTGSAELLSNQLGAGTSGTTLIKLTGSNVLRSTVAVTGVAVPIEINAPGNTVTIESPSGGVWYVNLQDFVYTAGRVQIREASGVYWNIPARLSHPFNQQVIG